MARTRKPPAGASHPAALGAAALAFLVLAGGCERRDKSDPADQTHKVTEIPTKTGVAMVLLPAGEFVLGDDAGEADERPAHKVRLSAFCIDKHEVTQKAYEALMGKNPAKFQDPDKPVERLSWSAAAKYCNARSLKEDLRPCYDLSGKKAFQCDFAADGYRLPTEAEWEYACRAGAKGISGISRKYSFGNDSRDLGRYAWFDGNAAQKTHPVGQRQPNPWGLYDMHGNVAEWCNDWYAKDAYRTSEAADPRGPQSGEDRVLRGGSWRGGADLCRSSARDHESPGLADVCFGYEAYGFRCVKRAPTP